MLEMPHCDPTKDMLFDDYEDTKEEMINQWRTVRPRDFETYKPPIPVLVEEPPPKPQVVEERIPEAEQPTHAEEAQAEPPPAQSASADNQFAETAPQTEDEARPAATDVRKPGPSAENLDNPTYIPGAQPTWDFSSWDYPTVPGPAVPRHPLSMDLGYDLMQVKEKLGEDPPYLTPDEIIWGDGDSR